MAAPRQKKSTYQIEIIVQEGNKPFLFGGIPVYGPIDSAVQISASQYKQIAIGQINDAIRRNKQAKTPSTIMPAEFLSLDEVENMALVDNDGREIPNDAILKPDISYKLTVKRETTELKRPNDSKQIQKVVTIDRGGVIDFTTKAKKEIGPNDFIFSEVTDPFGGETRYAVLPDGPDFVRNLHELVNVHGYIFLSHSADLASEQEDYYHRINTHVERMNRENHGKAGFPIPPCPTPQFYHETQSRYDTNSVIGKASILAPVIDKNPAGKAIYRYPNYLKNAYSGKQELRMAQQRVLLTNLPMGTTLEVHVLDDAESVIKAAQLENNKQHKTVIHHIGTQAGQVTPTEALRQIVMHERTLDKSNASNRNPNTTLFATESGDRKSVPPAASEQPDVNGDEAPKDKYDSPFGVEGPPVERPLAVQERKTSPARTGTPPLRTQHSRSTGQPKAVSPPASHAPSSLSLTAVHQSPPRIRRDNDISLTPNPTPFYKRPLFWCFIALTIIGFVLGIYIPPFKILGPFGTTAASTIVGAAIGTFTGWIIDSCTQKSPATSTKAKDPLRGDSTILVSTITGTQPGLTQQPKLEEQTSHQPDAGPSQAIQPAPSSQPDNIAASSRSPGNRGRDS